MIKINLPESLITRPLQGVQPQSNLPSRKAPHFIMVENHKLEDDQQIKWYLRELFRDLGQRCYEKDAID